MGTSQSWLGPEPAKPILKRPATLDKAESVSSDESDVPKWSWIKAPPSKAQSSAPQGQKWRRKEAQPSTCPPPPPPPRHPAMQAPVQIAPLPMLVIPKMNVLPGPSDPVASILQFASEVRHVEQRKAGAQFAASVTGERQSDDMEQDGPEGENQPEDIEEDAPPQVSDIAEFSEKVFQAATEIVRKMEEEQKERRPEKPTGICPGAGASQENAPPGTEFQKVMTDLLKMVREAKGVPAEMIGVSGPGSSAD